MCLFSESFFLFLCYGGGATYGCKPINHPNLVFSCGLDASLHKAVFGSKDKRKAERKSRTNLDFIKYETIKKKEDTNFSRPLNYKYGYMSLEVDTEKSTHLHFT